MPDIHFDHPEIDTELLPCHNIRVKESGSITTQVAQYFWEAMRLFIWLKKEGKLGSTSIVAHRAFIGCVSYHHDTTAVECADPRYFGNEPQEFYFYETAEQKKVIPYTSLEVVRDGSISSWPPRYYIKFHHEQGLPVGYFDDKTHTYYAIGDADFQRRWTALLEKMLQTGFVSFLQWHSESLTSEHVRTLLARNLPRLSNQMIADIQGALLQVK